MPATNSTTFTDYSTTVVATWLNDINDSVLDDAVNVKRYGATGNGTTDDTTSIQTAITAAAGRPIYFPTGVYRITSTLDLYPAAFVSSFGAGPKFFGDGIGKTYFDNQVANGPMFNLDANGGAHGTFQAILGAQLQGFTIKTTTSPVVSSGIKLRASFLVEISQVHIIGMTADGIQIPCTVGDNDGANMVKLRQVRIENCAGWGIKADGDATFNEMSFLGMEQVFIQACGTTSASTPPPSGGMIWKGQILVQSNCAFTLNENVALFIKGESGLANNCSLESTTYENNKKRGLYCTGITSLKGRNLQFYNNNTYTSTVACEFDGTTYTVRQVDIDGVVVRATSSNNPYTAFKISGANAELISCRVRNVEWNNFDYTGQTRFSGWQFDEIVPQCRFDLVSNASMALRPRQSVGQGNVMPLRLRGGAGGLASASGEWVEYQVASTGLTISNASLAASTLYYAYLYDATGATTLALSTVAPQLDTATGYWVNSGTFATTVLVGQALCVGSIATDSGVLFHTMPGAIVYSTSITPNANLSLFPGSSEGTFTITGSDGVAFAMNTPSGGLIGQVITITIRNASGGALGVATWNANYKMSTWTQPANGYSRSITFRYIGASAWVQIGQTGVDVPN